MGTESWHDERDRLMKLLMAIEDGTITHVETANEREMQLANPVVVEALRTRLAQLNARLGNERDNASRRT